MSYDQWVMQLFEQALELPTEERTDFLNGAANDNRQLFQEVEQLLLAHQHAEHFLPDDPSSSSPLLHGERPVGTIIDQYVLTQILGRGGMGVVYQARDTVINRDVAVKFLPQSIAADEESSLRFLNEARAAGQLNHPHVVSLFAVGHHEGDMYLVMELARRGNVVELLANSDPLDWAEASRIVCQACRGLGAAHQAGFIHRDVKPENLLLSEHNITKVADFGVARFVYANSLGGMTDGAGTPNYMSPEQCRGEKADVRSDVYSLGATYFTLLTGRKPYADATTPLQVMSAHCNGPVPDATQVNPEVPQACAEIVARAMSKSPSDRFPSCEKMETALQKVLRAAGVSSESTNRDQATQIEAVARRNAGQSGAAATTARSLAKWVVHVVVALAACAAILTLLATFRRDGSDPVNFEPPTAAKVGADPTHSLRPTDREIARQVLEVGGQVDIRSAEVASRVVENVADLPPDDFNVTWISLEHNRRADDGLISDFTHLEHLVGVSLQSTAVTNDGVRRLAEIESLSRVFLSDTKVTDDGVLTLAHLPKLNHLVLSRTAITDRSLQGLRNTPLVLLRLDGTATTDNGVDYLSRMQTLRILSLRNTQVTNEALQKLSSLTRLQDICIAQTRITDEGLQWLHAMPSLTKLIVSDPMSKASPITPQGVARLQAALPECEIEIK